MTAPVLAHKKFYIIKPATGRNYIKNPIFSPPDYEQDWSYSGGTGGTIEETGDQQRFGAYSMQVNPITGQAANAYYDSLTVENGSTYTFSAYVKGTVGETFRVYITDSSGGWPIHAHTDFTATGYWQRKEATWTATGNSSTIAVVVQRKAIASTDPFYVDGVQFERYSSATTLMEGYMPGCRWEGHARNSSTYRNEESGLGGRLYDLSDYCEIVQVTGLGHGDWNQILTKMTAGGDMYQTHTRKSRNFSIIVDFTGNSLGEIEANRDAVLKLIRPDLLYNRQEERRIIRYQGVDVNGNEATNPVDIVCVPLPATLTDTPDLPSYQRAVLNFTIPSGLLNGAYNEGAELDWIADFPAEYIVRRDADGKWCEWGGSSYENPMKGQGTTQGLNSTVWCMAEGPDGKIYVGGDFTDAGGVANADYLARWNPVSEKWEAVVADLNTNGNGSVRCMDFDANGDLYIGGVFYDGGPLYSGYQYIYKITDLDGTPTINKVGEGADGTVLSILCAPDGAVYVGGSFTSVRNTSGGVSGTLNVAVWLGTYWDNLGTGLGGAVRTIAIGSKGVYFGGDFTNADGAYGDYLCYWDAYQGSWNSGGSFHRVLGEELNAKVSSIVFTERGEMYIGGDFTDADVNTDNADYIAKINNAEAYALTTGTNGSVNNIFLGPNNRLYVVGSFTTAGGLTLTDRVAVYSNGAWLPLDIDLPGTAIVYAILTASDGSLYIGGDFSTAGETPDENAECGIISDRVYEIGVASASANTYPFMQVRGPGTLKTITNHGTGKMVAFDGLTLRPGELINLHFDPLNLQFYGGWKGRGNLMRYIVPGSDYGDFYLRPGSNTLSLFMTGTDSNSGATISWTPLFWGIDGALL